MFDQFVQLPYEIVPEILDEWTAPARPMHYFQLAYIREGKGVHHVNGNSYPYSNGKLFLLSPDDQHSFDIQTTTGFLFIRFSQLFILQLKDDAERLEQCDWMKKTDYIFHNYHSKAGCIFRDPADESLAATLLQSIEREHLLHGKGYRLIIRQSMSILLNLIARNLLRAENTGVAENSGRFSIMQIISYLQEHVYEPQQLKLPQLAARFNISTTYLGEYFRKHTGQSIQEYVIEYKLKLVETRLGYSNMRMQEIAEELGFTDESYLSRLFKKRRGITPGAYRKQLQPAK